MGPRGSVDGSSGEDGEAVSEKLHLVGHLFLDTGQPMTHVSGLHQGMTEQQTRRMCPQRED